MGVDNALSRLTTWTTPWPTPRAARKTQTIPVPGGRLKASPGNWPAKPAGRETPVTGSDSGYEPSRTNRGAEGPGRGNRRMRPSGGTGAGGGGGGTTPAAVSTSSRNILQTTRPARNSTRENGPGDPGATDPRNPHFPSRKKPPAMRRKRRRTARSGRINPAQDASSSRSSR